MSINLNQPKSISSGFSLLEIILAVTFISLVFAYLLGTIYFGVQSRTLTIERNKALLLAEEGLENARFVKNNYGLDAVEFELEELGDFRRIVTVEDTDNDDVKKVISEVSWELESTPNGTLTLSSYLSKWDEEVLQP